MFFFFFFQAEDGIRDLYVTGVQTCALPIYPQSLAEARFQALGMEVQPDTVEPSTAPSFGGVGQKAVEQRRSKTGQLGLGMVRQGFGVERYSCDFRSNKKVIDPWLDLVPGAIASFHIISDKLLQRRGRLYQ